MKHAVCDGEQAVCYFLRFTPTMRHSNIAIICLVAVLSLVAISSPGFAQISLTGGVYSENFDGMSTAGTVPPANWTVTSSAGPEPGNAPGMP